MRCSEIIKESCLRVARANQAFALHTVSVHVVTSMMKVTPAETGPDRVCSFFDKTANAEIAECGLIQSLLMTKRLY